jgi:hypothetical protein
MSSCALAKPLRAELSNQTPDRADFLERLLRRLLNLVQTSADALLQLRERERAPPVAGSLGEP